MSNLTTVRALIVVALFLIPQAHAKRPALSKSPGVKALKKGLKVIKEGRFSRFKTVKVTLEDGKRLAVPQLAKKLFVNEIRADKELKRAFKKKVLFKAPVIEEHAIETKDLVTLTRATSYIVSDRKKLAQEFPDLIQFEPDGTPTTKSDVKMAVLLKDKDHKAWFDALKKDILSEPKSHPLRAAYDKDGDAGLVAAAMNGLGEITVTDTVIVPKQGKLASGELQKPEMTPNGIKLKRVQMAKAKKPETKGKAQLIQVKAPIIDKSPRRKATTEYKTVAGAKNEGGFLTGFSKTKGWKKNKKIGGSFIKAEFEVNFGYAFGLRVPIEVTWQMKPALAYTTSGTRSGKDRATKGGVTLTAKPAEKPKGFYKAVGLDSKKIYNGKEMYVGAWASAGMSLKVGGKKVFGKTIGLTRKKAETCIKTGKGTCFSREMQPPWGKKQKLKIGKSRSKMKTPTVWLPASLTKTYLEKDIGIAKGWAKAQAGFKFGGKDSKINIDFRAVINGKKEEVNADFQAG